MPVEIKKSAVTPSVDSWTLSNGSVSMEVLNYGCTILSITAPDRDGNVEEVTLNHRTYSELSDEANFGPYYGCVAGRVANRVAKGLFDLNGQTYRLPINNGENSLHGGLEGFNKKLFSVQSSVNEETGSGKIECNYTSKDGEEGYPGTINVIVVYTLTMQNSIEMEYNVQLEEGQILKTIINLTNHTYFNMSGNCRDKAHDHTLQLSCSKYCPPNEKQIPTGDIVDVKGSSFDFTEPTELGQRIDTIDGCGEPGLDHNFVVDGALDTTLDMSSVAAGAGPAMRYVATLTHEKSGRKMILHASQPGVQVYTANWLSKDNSEHPFIQHNGVCLETQHFPDSINQPTFPSCVLSPGETYNHKAIFSFAVTK